jgi:hypothetical protein
LRCAHSASTSAANFAAAVAVIGAQDGVEVVQHFLARQEFADHVADHRRAPEAAADDHAGADLTRLVFHDVDADVVHQHRRAVFAAGRDGDLELARQEGEFRVEGGPLADQLAIGARVHQLVVGDAGELV